MSVNKVILVGRLGADPETRFTQSGDAVTSCSIATFESWKDKQGQKQESTEWHRVTFFRKLAEIAGQYLKKGSQVYIEGKIKTEKYQDKVTGEDKYTTKIIANEMRMIGVVDAGDADKEHKQNKAPSAPRPQTDDFDDDIPF